MSNTKKCDRCSELYDVDDGADVIFEYPGVEEPPMRYSLCFECVNEIACFIEGIESIRDIRRASNGM